MSNWSTILREALLIGMDLAATHLKGSGSEERAKSGAADIIREMALEAAERGLTSLPPEFRAPYERRILDLWMALGLTEGV